MRIVIFTPMSRESAIAKMATEVAAVLVQMGCEINIVRTEHDWIDRKDNCSDAFVVTEWYDDESVEALIESADALVHHVGNNFDFHVGSVVWLERVPGIVCLHDFFLGHLFYGWSSSRRQEALQVLDRLYGPDVANNYFVYNNPEDFIEGTREAAPMTEWIAELASAVITHSSWGTSRVKAACRGPVVVTPLAYSVDEPSYGRRSATNDRSDKLQLLTVGHANPNKRIPNVIRAIGASEVLRESVTYHIVGPISAQYAWELAALARSNDVRIRVHGAVDQSTLENRYVKANVVACLRNPALEAASASAIEALLHGLPTLVLDTGFYRELPNELVVKISPDEEVAGLTQALESLLTDRTGRDAMGRAAQMWASSTFSAGNYAETLMRLAAESKSHSVAIPHLGVFAKQLAAWGGRGAVVGLSLIWDPLMEVLTDEPHIGVVAVSSSDKLM